MVHSIQSRVVNSCSAYRIVASTPKLIPRHRTAVSDARAAAKAQVAVGVLQLPRTRTERYRHLEILDRIPFDLVPACEERLRIQARAQPLKGSIGRIMRRYRKDGVSVVLNTMLQACVNKRHDELLWDTIAASLHDEISKMTAADAGIALVCLMKSGYSRDPDLPNQLVRRLAVAAVPASSNASLSKRSTSFESMIADNSLHAPTLPSGGRRHKRLERARDAHKQPKRAGVSKVSAMRKSGASEHALSAGFAALHHFKLSRSLAADTNRLCVITSQSQSALSNRILCRIAHYAGSIAASEKKHGPIAKLMGTFRQELRCRLDLESGVDDWIAGDLCLVAHAYAHSQASDQDRPLFEALRDRLTVVVLLQLSPSEIAGLANSFSKLKHAEELGHVGLFDQMGRQLVGASEKVGLRETCVALNAFAHASVRHEPFFVAFEAVIPKWLNDQDCNLRQLAMMAHAYVRVGLQHSSLLPMVWIRAARLAKSSDAHSLSLMLFAITKASAADTVGGEQFVREMGNRLMYLLAGPGSLHSNIEPATIAVTVYALVRGGCIELVNPALWKILAATATKGLNKLPLSDASNIASALVQVTRESLPIRELVQEELAHFFQGLQQRVETEVAGAQASTLSPLVASKIISAFGAAKCFDAGPMAQHLARRCLVAGGSARLGIGPLRSVAQALVQLRVHDEDLLQALTIAQKPRPRRR